MESHTDDCAGCSLGRRSFLKDMAVAAAALAAIGSTAEAMSVDFISALAERGRDVSYPIPAKDGVSIDKDKEVVLARNGANVFAFVLSCPHQNTALRWNAKDKKFQCPKHKSQYTPDGVFIDGRATRSMDRFEVRKEGNNILVNMDKVYEEDSDPKEWKAAFVTI